MNEKYQAIIEAIKKESRKEYGDSTVFGGFSRFVADTLEHDADPRARASVLLASRYGTAGKEERREILKRIFVLLQTGEEENSAIEKKEVRTVLLSQGRSLEENVASPKRENSAPEKNSTKTTPSRKKGAVNSLQYLKHVGPKRVGLLKKLGIATVDDLIEYFPKRHEDRRKVTSIADLISDVPAVIRGVVQKTESLRLKKNLQLFKAYLNDDSGGVVALWYNQTWLKDQIHEGCEVLLYGKADFRYGKRQFTVTEFSLAEKAGGFGILPIYGLTEGLSQKLIRTIVQSALHEKQGQIGDFLPENVRKRFDFVGREWAINHYHFPDSLEELKDARRRLVFDEFFLLRMGQGVNGQHIEVQGISQAKGNLDEFSSFLPFTLTNAQKRAVNEIFLDMAAPNQMMRLVEGDVGSGKTVVAAAAIYRAVRSGHQCALMAPTELLARQHYQSLCSFFENSGLRIGLLTGDTKGADKQNIYRGLAAGKLDLLVGTHALIEEKTVFRDLSLVVIDEQHRFGVRQRETLAGKGNHPDTLILTATPIPRTLAMTVFAGLSLSVLDELPPGRIPVKTYVVTEKEESRALTFIRKHAEAGHQCYIVCPLVEESESLDLASATELYERLKKGAFQNLSLGLVHGKMNAKEKDTVMDDFRNGKISVLISTTVIEVGVDVPNATVMMVRDAHRFGLAQLHQIRGRIGRGKAQSHCILEYNGSSEYAKKRMEIMLKYQDGFRIAEEDLKLRGPGDFFGTRQHGLAELKIADLYVDHEILKTASSFAEELLTEDPKLNREPWRPLREYLEKNHTIG